MAVSAKGWFLNQSIKRKIVLLITFVVTGISAFMFYFFPSQQKKVLIAETIERAEVAADLLGINFSMALGEGNFATIQRAYRSVKKIDGLEYIAIYDSDSELINAHNPNKHNIQISEELLEKSLVISDDFLMIKSEIEYDDENLGFFVIGFSLDWLNAKISSLYWTTFGVLVLLLIASLIVGVIISGFISRPLYALSNAAREVSRGNLGQRVDITTLEETGELAGAFNTMADHIAKALSDLEEERRAIEGKVADAVDESERHKQYLADSVDIILKEMQRFADGDLTMQLPDDRDGEIGKLFAGFNRAVQNLRQLLLKVVDLVQATNVASEEITANLVSVARGAEEQTDQTNSVAGASEQMASSSIENNNLSEQAVQMAEQAKEAASAGGDIITKTIKRMDSISTVVNNTADSVRKLGRSSSEIGEIIGVIKEIADQTNLLALNAAIEAARAGEKGRGFAVVADEVRMLAERTSDATGTIVNMIKTIQGDTDEAVNSMHKATEEVDQGKRLVDQAGDTLETIIARAEKVMEMIAHVATASQEQTSTSKQINLSIAEIHKVAEDTASRTRMITEIAQRLQSTTSDLQGLIRSFKLETSAEEQVPPPADEDQQQPETLEEEISVEMAG